MAKTFTVPEMPLTAAVWFDHPGLAPTLPPDALLPCSLSPIRPEDWLRGTPTVSIYRATHIIRCPADPSLQDNLAPREQSDIFPCSLFEVPNASGHFYAALWSHICGAGFENEHGRVYVVRANHLIYPEKLPFTGWI